MEAPETGPIRQNGQVFYATLLPHRSLSRKGFIVLMAALCSISFIAGILFVAMGAWPVTGFFGLDVLLVYLAFRFSFRAGRMSETIDLRIDELIVTRISPDGRKESWGFNPYWVRLEVQEENAGKKLSLASHGKRLVIGRFLAPDEKERLAKRLTEALFLCRNMPLATD
jgi:uncharacterized membrane protein